MNEEMCHKCKKYPAECNQTECEFCLGISSKDDYIKNLQQRINKAIEYIETNDFIYNHDCGDYFRKIKNILKGDDKE